MGGWGSRFNSAWKEVLQSGGYCGAGNLHKLGTKYILQSPINGDFSTPGPYLAKQNGQQKTLVFPLQSNQVWLLAVTTVGQTTCRRCC